MPWRVLFGKRDADTSAMNTHDLTLDARNRALRTLMVNLAIDVLTAVTMAVTEVLNTSGNDVDWRLMVALVAKTAAATVGSFLLRRFGDPSSVWTPLPPSPQPAPADPIEPGDKF